MGSARRNKSFEAEQARRDSKEFGLSRLDATGIGLGYETTPRAPIKTTDKTLINTTWKLPAIAATTTNSALATTFENGDVIDGVTLSTGDRILIKNQTAGSENGIYIVNATGTPTRASDFDDGFDSIAGVSVIVEEGTTNADTFWFLSTNNPITLDTTSLTFTEFTSGGSQTPWTLDIDGDGFDLKDLSNIEFRNTTGTPASSVPNINVASSGDMVFNVANTDQFFFQVDGTSAAQLLDGELEIRSTFGTATTGPQLSILNNDSGIIDNDRVGLLSYRALNSTPAETQYGSIELQAKDVTAGTEDAQMTFSVMKAGIQSVMLALAGESAEVVISAGADVLRPSSDGGKELGTSSKHWDDVFSETFTLKDTGGNTTGSATTIYATTSGMILNVPAGRGSSFKINNVEEYRFNGTEIDMNGNDIIDISNLEFTPQTTSPNTNAPHMTVTATGNIRISAVDSDTITLLNGNGTFSFSDGEVAARNTNGPETLILENTSTASAGTVAGTLSLKRKNDALSVKEYGKIETVADVVTSGSEQGTMTLGVATGTSGAIVTGIEIEGSSGSTTLLGFYNTTPVVQPSHIVDADGTLADITTKFNQLLADLAGQGLQAAS